MVIDCRAVLVYRELYCTVTSKQHPILEKDWLPSFLFPEQRVGSEGGRNVSLSLSVWQFALFGVGRKTCVRCSFQWLRLAPCEYIFSKIYVSVIMLSHLLLYHKDFQRLLARIHATCILVDFLEIPFLYYKCFSLAIH